MQAIIHKARMAAWLFASTLMVQGLLVGSAAAGQKHMQQGQMGEQRGGQLGQQGIPTQTGESLIKADDLVGKSVRNLQDEELGSIAEIAIDRGMQQAAYVVVSRGGFLGMRQNKVAVPITALQKRAGEDYVVLNVSKDRFDTAPAFEGKNYPAKADQQFWTQAGIQGQQGQLGGQRPSDPVKTGERSEGQSKQEQQKVYTFSDHFKDVDVKARGNQDIGKLTNVLIDTHEGRLVYGVIELKDEVRGQQQQRRQATDEQQEAAGKLAVVPWSLILVRPEQQTATVQTDRTTLFAAATAELPPLDLQHLTRISERFGTEPYWEVFGYPPPQAQSLQDQEMQQQREPDMEERAPMPQDRPLQREGAPHDY